MPKRPKVSALVLAAGQSRRMGGRDKLMEPVAGRPLLRHVVEAVLASAVEDVAVVLPPDAADRGAALEGSGARIVLNPRAEEGMGRSIAAGMAALGPETDAVMVVLADMPDLGPADFDRLIAAFDQEEGRAIVRAVTAAGKPGHPVLFARRFFELLSGLEGDHGARGVVEDHREYLTDVPVTGDAASVDLDTPEDWAAWRASRAEPNQTESV
ncbi:MAG: nucleotidyltransferase family protein [Paracoccaceae bacterium]|nr:nucleotidyltransferase family protein [Paracoccaceae bacterium]